MPEGMNEQLTAHKKLGFAGDDAEMVDGHDE